MQPPVWVRFLETVEPTLTDRQRYDAGSTWACAPAHAATLVAAGVAEVVEPPTVSVPTVWTEADPTPEPEE